MLDYYAAFYLSVTMFVIYGFFWSEIIKPTNYLCLTDWMPACNGSWYVGSDRSFVIGSKSQTPQINKHNKRWRYFCFCFHSPHKSSYEYIFQQMHFCCGEVDAGEYFMEEVLPPRLHTPSPAQAGHERERLGCEKNINGA